MPFWQGMRWLKSNAFLARDEMQYSEALIRMRRLPRTSGSNFKSWHRLGNTAIPLLLNSAVSEVQDASKRLGDASLAVETDLRWKAIFSEEQRLVATQMAVYEQERQVRLLPALVM